MPDYYLNDDFEIILTLSPEDLERVSQARVKQNVRIGKSILRMSHLVFCHDECARCAVKQFVKEWQVSVAGETRSDKLAGDYNLLFEALVYYAHELWSAGWESSRLVDELVRHKKHSDYSHLSRYQLLRILKVGSLL